MKGFRRDQSMSLEQVGMGAGASQFKDEDVLGETRNNLHQNTRTRTPGRM